MANTYAYPYNGMQTQPMTLPKAQEGYDARLKTYMAYITFASQASADTITLFKIPKGVLPIFGFAIVSATTGSATLAFGNSGTAAKYRAAAAITTANIPQLFMVNIPNPPVVPTADEEVIATIGGAALPSSGTMVIGMFCATL